MKALTLLSSVFVIILALSGCKGRNPAEKRIAGADTTSVPDTGYTGIKQYMSGDRIVKEVTFKNGIREGLMKTFYPGGQIYQTFWYEKGLKQDSGRYYYVEGQLFRTTPYKNDTIDGIQKQYYRTGKLKAMIGYSKGMRTSYLQEFTQTGKLIREYPEIVVTVNDEYKTRGLYRVTLELSDKKTKVKFNIGELMNERFDTTFIKPVNTVNGKAVITLKKTGKAGKNNMGIIGEITTPFGNRHIVYKRLDLPYNDLN